MTQFSSVTKQFEASILDIVNTDDIRSTSGDQNVNNRNHTQPDPIRPSAKDIPKFSGKNVEGSLLKITKFFHHYHTKDEKRIFLATQSLEGEVLE